MCPFLVGFQSWIRGRVSLVVVGLLAAFAIAVAFRGGAAMRDGAPRVRLVGPIQAIERVSAREHWIVLVGDEAVEVHYVGALPHGVRCRGAAMVEGTYEDGHVEATSMKGQFGGGKYDGRVYCEDFRRLFE